MDEKPVTLNVHVDRGLKKAVKLRAAEDETSVSSVVRAALIRYLAEEA